VNKWLNSIGIQGTTFTDPINAKTAATNSTTAKVGSVAVFDWSGKSRANADEKDH